MWVNFITLAACGSAKRHDYPHSRRAKAQSPLLRSVACTTCCRLTTNKSNVWLYCGVGAKIYCTTRPQQIEPVDIELNDELTGLLRRQNPATEQPQSTKQPKPFRRCSYRRALFSCFSCYTILWRDAMFCGLLVSSSLRHELSVSDACDSRWWRVMSSWVIIVCVWAAVNSPQSQSLLSYIPAVLKKILISWLTARCRWQLTLYNDIQVTDTFASRRTHRNKSSQSNLGRVRRRPHW